MKVYCVKMHIRQEVTLRVEAETESMAKMMAYQYQQDRRSNEEHALVDEHEWVQAMELTELPEGEV